MKSLPFFLSHSILVRILNFLLITVVLFSTAVAEQPIQILFPRAKINANELAVIYIKGNVQSEAIADYYQTQRNIPENNMFDIALSSTDTRVAPDKFIQLKQKLDQELPNNIQALALAWAQPYSVGCMSITSAFALGYDEKSCSKGCATTKPNQYHNSKTTTPYTSYSIRPTMMLAAENFDDAKALIDRGVAADNTRPYGNAYLLNTKDFHRSVRNIYYDEVKKRFNTRFDIHLLEQNSIKDKQDILFYFTGLPTVPDIDTLTYLPGAMADHLTSTGGQLTDSSQMSAMKWLEAGATGSYGSAHEPCNYTQKFPNPIIAMTYYTRGSTLIEAYWKSVLMPGQGNFIGEPLAAPFTGYDLIDKEEHIEIQSPFLYRGTYTISSETDDNIIESTQSVSKKSNHLIITPPYRSQYTIRRNN